METCFLGTFKTKILILMTVNFDISGKYKTVSICIDYIKPKKFINLINKKNIFFTKVSLY